MRYIDKEIYQKDFDTYTIRYLQNAQANDGTFIPPLESKSTFENFSQSKYKLQPCHGSTHEGWLSILLEEQENRCCYCMRRLDNNSISVEHLVPESFEGLDEDDEYNFYATHASAIREYVITCRNFVKASKNLNIKNNEFKFMPHLIAHSNLFPACQSNKPGCSCNNHRGNHRILPLMLMPNVNSLVEYNTAGECILFHCDIEASFSTLKHLDINTNALKKIRHLWYLFSHINLCPTSSSNNEFKDRDRLLRLAFGISPNEILPLEYQNFLSDTYWQLFLQYDWFFGYYKKLSRL
jgi:hypothetical protein